MEESILISLRFERFIGHIISMITIFIFKITHSNFPKSEESFLNKKTLKKLIFKGLCVAKTGVEPVTSGL